MQTITHTQWGETFTLAPIIARYDNGRTAVSLVVESTGEPFATVTVNVPDAELAEGELLVKDWAENEQIVDTLTEAGWLRRTGRVYNTGYVTAKVMTPGRGLGIAIIDDRLARGC